MINQQACLEKVEGKRGLQQVSVPGGVARVIDYIPAPSGYNAVPGRIRFMYDGNAKPCTVAIETVLPGEHLLHLNGDEFLQLSEGGVAVFARVFPTHK